MTLIILLILPLLFGLVAATIAHGKGRSALGWFILGALFPPFIIAVACLPRRKAVMERLSRWTYRQRRRSHRAHSTNTTGPPVPPETPAQQAADQLRHEAEVEAEVQRILRERQDQS